MPANQFERNVQERLDDFQLSPSAAVWQNVEAQIRRKRKRRVIIFFLLPLLAVVSGLLVYYFSHPAPGNRFTRQELNAPPINNPEKDLAERKSNPTTVTISTNTESESELIRKKRDDKKVLNRNEAEYLLRKNSPTATVADELLISTKTTSAKKSARRKNEGPTSILRTETEIPRSENDHLEKAEPASIDELSITPVTDVTVPGSSVNEESQSAPDTINRVSSKDSIVTKETEIKPRPIVNAKKWRFGLEASFGKSSLRTELFAVSVLAATQDYYSDLTGVGSGGPSVIIPPSIIRPGNAFSLGGIVSRQLSSRLNVSVGLRYAYASTNIKTGVKKDTSIVVENGPANYTNAYAIYRGVPVRDHENKFHSIQMPVAVQWKVNRNLPLYTSIGVSVGYMINTNALIYNRALGGFYFHDSKAFNHFQFGLNCGLSYGFKIKNSELQIGPVISMEMTRLMKKGYDTKGYMMFGGFTARYLFSGMKKN